MTEFENLDFFTTVVFVAFFSTLNYVIPGHVRLFIPEEFSTLDLLIYSSFRNFSPSTLWLFINFQKNYSPSPFIKASPGIRQVRVCIRQKNLQFKFIGLDILLKKSTLNYKNESETSWRTSGRASVRTFCFPNFF